MTQKSDKLMKLRAELDQVENEHQDLVATLFAGCIGLSDEEYWNAVDRQAVCEGEYGRVSAQIFRLENDLDADDLADLERAESELFELEGQKAALREKYGSEQPQSISDYWSKP